MTDINLRILLNASRGNTMSVIGDVTKALGSSGGLQGAMAALGVAALGAGVAITALAIDKAKAFQNAMLQNVAHAGLAKDQFNAVSQAVLGMSTDVGQMPLEMAQALYPILSGFSGITDQSAKAKTSLEALRLSAEDVVGTTIKTTVTSGALVSAFNALGLQTNNTATNMARLQTLNDQMEATIIAGNMHWDQYANVVGKLATAIKGTGVSWTEASAALATMTNEGFTAQRSQTYLANLFTQLDIKTDSMAKNAKKLGITFDENKFKTMSLADQLTYLKEATSGNQSELLKLLGGNSTALKTYNALSTGMKSYKTNLDAIKNSHGATKTAFDTASSSFKASSDRMKASIDVLLIDIGTQLLPVLSKFMDWLTPLIKKFADWISNSKELHTWLNNVGGFLQFTFVPWVNNTWNAISTLVGWLQKSSGPAQAVKGILGGIAAIVLGQKIGAMASDLGNLASKAADFVANSGKNLLAFFTGDTGLQGAAEKAGMSVSSIGTDAETSATEVTGASATMEGDLEAVGASADTAATSIRGIGTAATGIMGALGGLSLALSNLGASSGASSLQGQMDKAAASGANKAWLQYEWEKEHNFQNFGVMPDFHSWTSAQKTQAYNDWTASHPGVPFPWLTAQGYAAGIENFGGGLAYVHRGEVLANLAPGTSVVPAHRVNFGGGGVVIQNLVVNNPLRTRADTANLIDEIEREIALRTRLQTPGLSFGGLV